MAHCASSLEGVSLTKKVFTGFAANPKHNVTDSMCRFLLPTNWLKVTQRKYVHFGTNFDIKVFQWIAVYV